MIESLRRFTDRLLGRGSAAITVPVMDGTLKPNRALDDAEVVTELAGIDDLGGAHGDLWASAGNGLYRLEGARLAPQHRFDAPITAFAFSRAGRLAVALGGREVRVIEADGQPGAQLAALGGAPLVAVNALAWDGDDTLVFSDGSRQHAPDAWSRDLMTLGRSGRLGRWPVATAGAPAELLADRLAHAFGVLADVDGAGGVLVAESWQHRLMLRSRDASRPARALVAQLPGYPSRMAPAADGGFWLSCFVCRTQLVEFVLREPAYRDRMVAEIDPAHWIAPALSSGHSFLEPLQGAGVKNMGVLKPWAPPRSYGLVIHVGSDGRLLRSLHSQVDGRHHGITAVCELDGVLYAASKGSGRLLRVDLRTEQEDA